jgi:acetyltransferase-like isoleucine patch superfamily enzyme
VTEERNNKENFTILSIKAVKNNKQRKCQICSLMGESMSEKVTLGENSRIEGEKVELGKSIRIGKSTLIKGKEISIEDNVVIGDNTIISASKIHIGFGSKIEENCRITLAGANTRFSIGDNCPVGHDSMIIVPTFEAGDYVTLHNHLFVNGTKPCTIGSNVWVGQNCILNAADTLTIGNGVGIGTYSCVWTHGGHGELLEGCKIFKRAPIVIQDDVWIVGSYNVISPGITIGEKAVILTGSVVTKNVPPRACVAGNPAKNITDKVSTYREITVEEKFEMMKGFMKDFVDTFYKGSATVIENGWRVREGEKSCEILFLEEAGNSIEDDEKPKVVFTEKNTATRNYRNVSIFDLATKKYTKRRTEIEIKTIKFLLYSKARFLPL